MGKTRVGARVISAAALAGILVATVLAPVAGASVETPEWNPRIAGLARQVERLRGLKFERPVPVDFLSGHAFDKRVSVDEGKLSKAQKDQAAQSASELSAIGLVDHGINLTQSLNKLSTSGTLAYYSPVTKRVTVRGKTLDVATRVTLAHELTHALQDQHFDLQKLDRAATANGSSAALRALIEGDAIRIQNDYVKQLSAADQDQYERQNADDAARARAGATAGKVPLALEALFESPYDFGPAMLDVVKSQRQVAGINALFRKPPTSDSSYLTPTTVLDGSRPVKVAVPHLAAHEKRVGEPDTFGAFALYLMLALHSSPADALTVADGWGGDRMVTYKAGGQTCVRATFAGNSADATEAIRAALGQWAALMPAGSARLTGTGPRVTLTTCDVATVRPAPLHSASEALVLAVSRDQLLAEIAQEGVPMPVASCTANALVRDASFLPVLAAAGGEAQLDPSALATLRSRSSAIALDCASRALGTAHA